MDNFLDRYHLLTLNQDQVNNLNSSITTKEIKKVTIGLLTKQNNPPQKNKNKNKTKPNQTKEQNKKPKKLHCVKLQSVLFLAMLTIFVNAWHCIQARDGTGF